MSDTTLQRPDTVAKRRGCSKSQLYVDVNRGVVTPPIRRGKLALWPSTEVEQLIRSEIAGKTEDERRELVQKLLRERKMEANQTTEAA